MYCFYCPHPSTTHTGWTWLPYNLGVCFLLEEKNIILFWLPSHSTHLLQPLDVGIFSPLQYAYGREVDKYSRDSEEGINKSVFIPLLHNARIMAITKRNIKQAFATTSIMTFNPWRVYSKLKLGNDNHNPFPTNPLSL